MMEIRLAAVCSVCRSSSPIRLGPWPEFVKVGDMVESRSSEDSLRFSRNGDVFKGGWNCREERDGILKFCHSSKLWETLDALGV